MGVIEFILENVELYRKDIAKSSFETYFTELTAEQSQTFRETVWGKYFKPGEPISDDGTYRWEQHFKVPTSYSTYERMVEITLYNFIFLQPEIILFIENETSVYHIKIPDEANWLIEKICFSNANSFITNPQMDFLIAHLGTAGYTMLAFGGTAHQWHEKLDTKLFSELQIAPDEVVITQLQVQDWGNTLRLDCEYKGEHETFAFHIIFSDCLIGEWESHKYSSSQPCKLKDLLLYDPYEVSKRGHRGYKTDYKGATISGSFFRITFHYKTHVISRSNG
jgi:hypothetical protein